MKAPTASLFVRALAGCLLLAGTAAGATGAARTPLVVAGRIDTPIHPAAANFLNKLVKGAEKDGADGATLTRPRWAPDEAKPWAGRMDRGITLIPSEQERYLSG